MNRHFATWLLLLAAVACSGSETGETASAESIVSLGDAEPVTVRAGETTTLALPLTVAKEFKVQANPPAAEFLVPLELTLDPINGLAFGAPEYPPPQRHRLRGAADDLLTYEGDIVVRIPVMADHGAAGARTVTGSVRYQGCDSRRCFFPASIPISVNVVVVQNR